MEVGLWSIAFPKKELWSFTRLVFSERFNTSRWCRFLIDLGSSTVCMLDKSKTRNHLVSEKASLEGWHPVQSLKWTALAFKGISLHFRYPSLKFENNMYRHMSLLAPELPWLASQMATSSTATDLASSWTKSCILNNKSWVLGLEYPAEIWNANLQLN